MKNLLVLLTVAIGSVLGALSQATLADDIESVIFVRVPNKADGSPGIYYEPFMFHFGNSAHVPGAQLVKLSPPTPDGKLTILSEGFYSIEEPELSFDAKRILFVGQKTKEDNCDIWEMNIDGSGARQITHDMGDVCSPYYLPDGRIIFSSTRHVGMTPEYSRDEYDRDDARLGHRCDADGSNVEQITFNISSDSEFVVMRDGRILFQSWQHHGMRHHTSGASSFFTMNPDGTGFIDFYGNHRGGFRWKQREMPDGKIVFVDATFHHCYGGGSLGLITPGGPDDSATMVNLTPDVNRYGPDSKGGRYRDPFPTPDGRLMVSWSAKPAWSAYRNPGGPNVDFGIYWFDRDSKKVGEPIYNDAKYQSLNVIPVVATPVPRIVPDHAPDSKKTTGTLLCLNAYRGQLDKEAFIKPGQIKKVRIIEGFGIEDTDPSFRTLTPGVGYSSFGSSTNSISNFEQKRIIGEAPVEEDGSFYVEVPADTVLHWQVIDENGMALQDALTWAWVRPGENRLCIGCHEKRETISTLTSVPRAARKPPVVLNPPVEERHTVDFRRDVTPIIEAKCVRCHNEKQAEAGLDLSDGDSLVYQRLAHGPGRATRIESAVFNKAYLNLSGSANFRLGKLIHPGLARKSPLIWRMYGYSHQYDAAVNQCPPDEPLTDAEKKTFSLWIDLGAQWDNLPGDDPYIHYSREESRKLTREARQLIPKTPIADAATATQIRCMECHDLSKQLVLRKTVEEWKETIDDMADKRKDWIKPEEVDRIAEYLHGITENAGLIRQWQVCGPFDNRAGAGIRNHYAPETELDLAKTYKGKNGKPASWHAVDVKNPTAILNFEAVLGAMNQATAYAVTTVHSREEKTVWLRVCGDDMYEVIVDGKTIMQRLMKQTFSYDADQVAVRLKKGPNTIMIKVHDNYGPWRLRARLTDLPGPVAEAAVLADPTVEAVTVVERARPAKNR